MATGALVHRSLLVAHKLEKEGILVKVLNLSTIKPLDEHSLCTLAQETGAIVTVEEHQIAGGMDQQFQNVLLNIFQFPSNL